jgi:hypothetical protein
MTFHHASASQSSLKRLDWDQSLHLNWLEERGVTSETPDGAVVQPRRAMSESIMYQKLAEDRFHLSILLDDFLGERTAKTVKEWPRAEAEPGKATYRPAREGVGVSLELCIDDGCDMVGWYVAIERFLATGSQVPLTSRPACLVMEAKFSVILGELKNRQALWRSHGISLIFAATEPLKYARMALRIYTTTSVTRFCIQLYLIFRRFTHGFPPIHQNLPHRSGTRSINRSSFP